MKFPRISKRIIASLRRVLTRSETRATLNRLQHLEVAGDESLPIKLPENVSSITALPNEHERWGMSFRDVPGMKIHACGLFSIRNAEILMALDQWDCAYFTVRDSHGHLLPVRGLGIPEHFPINSPGPVQELSSGAFGLEIWMGNHGHWLAYHVPKLLVFQEHGMASNVILSRRRASAHLEFRDLFFLQILANSDLQGTWINPGRTRIRDLTSFYGDPHHPSILRRAADRLSSRFKASNASCRIWITRKKANYRFLVNEINLLMRLNELGFGEYCLEDMTHEQQISLFSRAEIVVATHGSGLANMLYCPRGTPIVEIVPNGFPCPDFYRLAVSLDLPYYFVAGQLVGQDPRGPGYCDMSANIDATLIAVTQAIARNH